ncbi:MAG: tRNA A37 threonylcarbamoyladenosine dehydratase [Oleiphilaceae bacterium]|jgi:tRNA A37 threonylcarbamoyladenosine dehydratase
MTDIPSQVVGGDLVSREVENEKIMSDDYLYRFSGIARLYGLSALNKFRKSHVAIIGVGGVGSWAAEALARSGIGTVTLFDLDDICVSNVNRQIHALDSTVGKMKIAAMAQRLKDISPELHVNAAHTFITPKNLEKYISSEFDYIFDATDSVPAKTALIAYCSRNKIKLICSGSAGGQIDPTQIQIADLNKTIQDPLLAKVRNNLRRLHGFSRNPKRKYRIDCVFSTEQLRYQQTDGSICQQKPSDSGPVKLDCATGFGSITHLTGSFAFIAVSQILKKLALSAE